MEFVLTLVVVVLFVGAVVLPWIQRGQIESLKADVLKLRAQLSQLREQVSNLAMSVPARPAAERPVAAPVPVVAPPVVVPEAAEPAPATKLAEDMIAPPQSAAELVPQEEEAAAPIELAAPQVEIEEPAPVAAAAELPPVHARPKISWEQQIGARLPVWVGGIALALSGIFLVKYSIDTGLLNPAVRCVLAGTLGAAMVGGAQFVIARGTIANGERIAQALSGAGIAVLYGTLFAAATVYGFISPRLAFAGMAAITALAVVLSVRHGPPIALLGMVGGFLTPGLIDSQQPNAAILFGYLAALTIGLFFVVRRQNWWWLGWPTLVGSYGWVVIWLSAGGAPGDELWLGLYLIVLSATAFSFVGAHVRETSGEAHTWAWLGLILTAGASVFLMCIVLARSQFGVTEWGLYGVLACGAIALAVWDQERYRYLPWMTMAASAVLFSVWVTPDTEFFALVLFLFAMLFMVSGTAMIWRAKDPVEWGGNACVSALIFYLIAFGRLREVTTAAKVLAADTVIGSWPVWGLIALILAVAATVIAGFVGERFAASDNAKPRLLAQFGLTAVVFLTIAIAVEFDRAHLAIAVAAEMFAVAWMSSRVDIPALRWATVALSVLFVLLDLPQLVNIIQYAAAATLNLIRREATQVPLVVGPLTYLGVPALMFALASYFLRRKVDDAAVYAFECGAIVLTGLMGYFLIRLGQAPAAHVLSGAGTPLDGGIITQTIFVYAIALVAAGQRFTRGALIACGTVSAVLAVARVVHFDIQPLQLFQVWVPMAVGKVSEVVTSLPIAESPIFYLGLPAVLLTLFRLTFGNERDDWLVRGAEYVAVVFAGLMGYFLIRHAFVPAAEVLTALGSRVEGGIISQAQIVYAIALVLAARFFARETLVHAGVIAAGMAVARIVVFDAQPLLLIGAAIKMSMGQEIDAGTIVPIAASPLFHLGIPALLIAAFAFVLSKSRGVALAPYFEYAAIAFTGFMGYYLIRHAFNPADVVFSSPGTYVERGVLTNALLLFGLALYAGGQTIKRQTMLVSGVAIAVFAVVRILFFDISTSSPLVAPHDVGTLPVLNALLLPYGLPIVWLLLLARALKQRGRAELLPYANGAALLFLFAWISLNVRQIFQGAILNAPEAGNNEVYAYSVAWLVLGVALLVAGAARKDRVVRLASLAIMVLTVAKVFLYDAAALEGLLRVASFFGLGLSLMGLSWFYMRYVFVREEPKAVS